MKVDPNAPAYPFVLYSHNPDGGFGSASSPGMSIRLAIAVQIMAGFAMRPDAGMLEGALSKFALQWADALIAAHNKLAE